MKKLRHAVFLSVVISTLGLNPSIGHAGEGSDDGTGTHGGQHLKDRFLLAKQYAEKFVAGPDCRKGFTDDQCKTMETKLKSSSPDWYLGSDCLKAVVHGKEQCVTASTTSKIDSNIQIDLNTAARIGITFMEAVVLMIHEAGHSIGLSDELITDQRITQILSQSDFGKSTEALTRTDTDSDWKYSNPLDPNSCLKLKEALEAIYDRESIGEAGLNRKGFEMVREIRAQHEDYLSRIWKDIGSKGLEIIRDFLKNQTNLGTDYDTLKVISDYTQGLRDDLMEEGVLFGRFKGPDLHQDIHKHTVDVSYKEQRIYFEICTYHYEDAQLVNATRFHECSKLVFSFGSYDRDGLPKGLDVDRQTFGDGGNYNDFIVRGQKYSLWSYPDREPWALKAIGYACEKSLRENGLFDSKENRSKK